MAPRNKTHTVSEDAYKRALLKKLRLASAVVEELARAAAASGQPRDARARAAAAARRERADETIASALEKLKAIGVSERDELVVASRSAASAVLERKLEKRAAAADERDAAKRSKHRDDAPDRSVKSESIWALHAMAKTVGAANAAIDAKSVAALAARAAADAERVNLKTCNAAIWSVAKISVRTNDDVECSHALGVAFNALLRRSAAFGVAELDARAASTTLWACASTRGTTVAAHADDGAMRRAVNVAAEAMGRCAATANAQDAANALWGAAKLRRSMAESCVEALIAVLVGAPFAVDGGEGVKIEEITIGLWALATFAGDGLRRAQKLASPLVKRAKEAAKRPKSWSAQAVANAAWAAGKLATSDDDDIDAATREECARDARQLVTMLIPAAKLATLTAQGFAHTLYAAAAVQVDARLVGDLARFTVGGLKTHELTLTSTDLASVVEAVRDLKLCSSMSDGTKLASDIAHAVERSMETFDWQACGRLDLALESIVNGADGERLLAALRARGKAACDAVDAERMAVERGSAEALLSLSGDFSALTAPFDENSATMLVVDDRHRLVTKKLRRVGWQTTMWQRFSCGEHAKGAGWIERDADAEPFATAVVRLPPTKAALDMVLHAVAANVRFGGRVWIYGAAAEGVRGVVTDLPTVCFLRLGSMFLTSYSLAVSSHRHTLSRACHARAGAFRTRCYIIGGLQLSQLTKGSSSLERRLSVGRIIMSLDRTP